MKRMLLASFLMFILNPCRSQWVDISPEIDIWLYDVSNPSDNTIIVVGSQGTILKSIDGGESWGQKNSGTTSTLYKVQFISPQIGFAIGNVILKSTDGGETWNEIYTGYSNFRDFTVLDENNIYILGFQKLIHTTDGGDAWELITNSPPSHTQVQFFEDGVGYIGEYKLFKTTDNGNSWDEIYSPNLEEYEGSPSSFINSNTGFTYWHGLTKFTNDGQIWLGSNPDFSELLDIFAVNENLIWGIIKGVSDFAPPSRGIVKATVIGETTTSYSDEAMWLPENVTLFSIKIFNDNGYVVGYRSDYENAVVWKNETGENYLKTIDVTSMEIPKIYPNPTSENINIDFTSNSSVVKVNLTDFMGKVFFSEEFINQLKINIPVSYLPKGIYLLTIKTNHKIYSHKIVIN